MDKRVNLGKFQIDVNEEGAFLEPIKEEPKDGYVMVKQSDWEAIMSFIDDRLQYQP